MINFEKHIKEIIRDYEMPYDHKEWLRLEKELPGKRSGISGKKLIAGGSILAVVLAVFLCYLIINDHNRVEKSTIVHITDNNKPEKTINPKSTTSTNNEIKEINKDKPKTCNSHIEKSDPGQTKEIQSDKRDEKNEVKKTENSLEQDNTMANLTSQTDKQKPDLPQPKDKPLPSANFSCSRTEGCTPLLVSFVPDEMNDSLIYYWDFGDGGFSTEKQPEHTYDNPGDYYMSLTVKYFKSEDIIKKNKNEPIRVFVSPIASFSWDAELYTYTFENLSKNDFSWKWYVDDVEAGTTENLAIEFTKNGTKKIMLQAFHLNGCSSTFLSTVEVAIHYNISFPNAITPNGDGKNDYWGPIGTNLEDYRFDIRVFNRNGQLVFQTNDPTVQWDGKIQGTNKPVGEGVYGYQAITTDKYGNTDKIVGDITILPDLFDE